jgi:hypothetical protein
MQMIGSFWHCLGRHNGEKFSSRALYYFHPLHAFFSGMVRGCPLLGHGGNTSPGSSAGGFGRREQKVAR